MGSPIPKSPGPVQVKRRIGSAGAPPSLLPGQFAINDPQDGVTQARLYGGVGYSTMYPTQVATLVSNTRQVELTGAQTITGVKTMAITNLKLTGGASGDAIVTDGLGNISFVAGGGGIFPEAPIDGQIYGRDGATASWVPVLAITGGSISGNLNVSNQLSVNDVPVVTEAPINGQLYVRSNASWVILPWSDAGGGGGPIAASSVTVNPLILGTNNVQAALQAIVDAGGGGFPEAPTDGQIYGRDGATTSWDPVLPLSGGTMLGTLILNGPPTGSSPANQAATAGYVDSLITGALQYIGTMNASNGLVTYTESSGITPNPGALISAALGHDQYVIVSVAGTIPAGAPANAGGAVVNVGDWLISDGTIWQVINVSGQEVVASNVAVSPPVLGQTNAQGALTALNSNFGFYLPLTGGELTGQLIINRNVSPPPAQQPAGQAPVLYMVGTDNVNALLSMDAFGTGSPAHLGRRARGTNAAPSGLIAGDSMAFFGGIGYGTTQYGLGGTGINLQAAQNWTDAAHGSMITVNTTPLGTTSAIVSMTLQGLLATFPGQVIINQNPSLALPPTPPAGVTPEFYVVGSDGGNLAVSMDAFGSGSPTIFGRRARGTQGAPTALLAGDSMLYIGGLGYGATNYAVGGTAINMTAIENWTDTAHGSNITFATVPAGTVNGFASFTITGMSATMNSKLILQAIANGTAPINIGPGASAPSAPINGDLWVLPSGMFAQINGATQQLATLAGINARASFSHGANIAYTVTSTAGVMAGLGTTVFGAGAVLTPTLTGAVLVIITISANNTTAGDGANMTIRYGTGTAPAQGAAPTGTLAGATSSMMSATAGIQGMLVVTQLITGLALGTPYWFDVQAAAITGGTATFGSTNVSLIEV